MNIEIRNIMHLCKNCSLLLSRDYHIIDLKACLSENILNYVNQHLNIQFHSSCNANVASK